MTGSQISCVAAVPCPLSGRHSLVRMAPDTGGARDTRCNGSYSIDFIRVFQFIGRNLTHGPRLKARLGATPRSATGSARPFGRTTTRRATRFEADADAHARTFDGAGSPRGEDGGGRTPSAGICDSMRTPPMPARWSENARNARRSWPDSWKGARILPSRRWRDRCWRRWKALVPVGGYERTRAHVVQRLGEQRDKQIAAELGLSAYGVRRHIRELFAKLGVRKRGDAVERARELGLLPDEC